MVHVRSLTAGTPAANSGPAPQRQTPRESWTAGTQLVAQRNASMSESGGTGWTRRGGGPGRSRHSGALRGRGGRDPEGPESGVDTDPTNTRIVNV